jgi:hypothetical protein
MKPDSSGPATAIPAPTSPAVPISRTHCQPRRQGREQAHQQNRQGRGETDQTARKRKLFGDALDQRSEGGNTWAQVDGSQDQRQHQQPAGGKIHKRSIGLRRKKPDRQPYSPPLPEATAAAAEAAGQSQSALLLARFFSASSAISS